MIGLDYIEILFIMDSLLFLLGALMVLTGLIILVKKAIGKEVQSLAATTSKLAQKGIADDIAGLVGNASALMNALQSMVKTATGIGVFLVMVGGLFIAGSLWIFINIDKFAQL
ncbi:MAG: hypothetical protein P8046_01510 [Anaerolineales bacterium]|jgi:hypothetical protein